jgi:hypothetical protein
LALPVSVQKPGLFLGGFSVFGIIFFQIPVKPGFRFKFLVSEIPVFETESRFFFQPGNCEKALIIQKMHVLPYFHTDWP